MPALRVAATIRAALTANRPMASYLLTNNWLMGRYLPRKVSASRLDRIIAKALGPRCLNLKYLFKKADASRNQDGAAPG